MYTRTQLLAELYSKKVVCNRYKAFIVGEIFSVKDRDGFIQTVKDLENEIAGLELLIASAL